MNKTWASGAVELIRHAAAHIQLDSAFDKRIAFISIDNAVEMMIRVYLSLPKQFFGENRPSRKEMDDCNNSFIQYLSLLSRYADKKMVGIDPGDIEHYHRIRNTLYHDGTGLAVDQEYLEAYFILAKLLLQRLFNVDISEISSEANLEKLILNWNQIEENLVEIFDSEQIHGGTYKWKEAVDLGLLSFRLVQDITSLRLARNQMVHSAILDTVALESIYQQSKSILIELNEKLKVARKLTRRTNFLYEPEISEISGKLILEEFYGNPGFGKSPDIDQIVKAWILILSKPINVHQNNTIPEEGEFNFTQYDLDRIQLSSAKCRIELKILENQTVTAIGTFFGGHTCHHFTPVLMDVLKLDPLKLE